MIHAHLTALVLTVILFVTALVLQGKGRNIKIVKMMVRLMYLSIIITGGMLFFTVFKITFLYVLKSLLGLGMIGLMEMILAARSKSGLPILFIGTLIAVVYLGITLPMGMYFFH